MHMHFYCLSALGWSTWLARRQCGRALPDEVHVPDSAHVWSALRTTVLGVLEAMAEPVRWEGGSFWAHYFPGAASLQYPGPAYT